MRAAVLVFPGSNCDKDAGGALESRYAETRGLKVDYVWHKDQFSPEDYRLIIVPGGFSYGDYLRTGAMARFSPVMRSVAEYAKTGRYLMGICNGFQILCEAHLLPGALTRNRMLKHIATDVEIKRVNSDSAFTSAVGDQWLTIPVSHGDGRFFIGEDDLSRLRDNSQIAFIYREDFNGAVANIAGVLNREKNILGLMPHPERVMSDGEFHSTDGRYIFDSLVGQLQ